MDLNAHLYAIGLPGPRQEGSADAMGFKAWNLARLLKIGRVLVPLGACLLARVPARRRVVAAGALLAGWTVAPVMAAIARLTASSARSVNSVGDSDTGSPAFHTSWVSSSSSMSAKRWIGTGPSIIDVRRDAGVGRVTSAGLERRRNLFQRPQSSSLSRVCAGLAVPGARVSPPGAPDTARTA